jgi:hypothetical protein
MAISLLSIATLLALETTYMLDRSHDQLLAKYDSTDGLDFNGDELAAIYRILNLDGTTFAATRLPEYRAVISEALREQNKVMTELSGEYLNRVDQGSKLEAMSYLVHNIARIRSPYMLNILVGLFCDKVD